MDNKDIIAESIEVVQVIISHPYHCVAACVLFGEAVELSIYGLTQLWFYGGKKD